MTPCFIATAPARPSLLGQRDGSVSIEFALVAIPLFALILGLFGLGFDFYVSESLEFSLAQATRQVQLGNIPATDTARQFTATIFCPVFAALADCSRVSIVMHPVMDFQTDPSLSLGTPAAAQSQPFCTGAPGQLMFARVFYPLPLFSWFWPAPPIGGGSATPYLVANAAFANENPAGVAISAAGGC